MSAIRTAVYGTLGAFFALNDAETLKLLDAAVLGAVLADYMTWVMRSVVVLPQYIWHGCYEGLVNLAFGWFFFRYVRFDVGTDGESLAVMFLAVMLVTGIKAGIYGAEFLYLEQGVFYAAPKLWLSVS